MIMLHHACAERPLTHYDEVFKRSHTPYITYTFSAPVPCSFLVDQLPYVEAQLQASRGRDALLRGMDIGKFCSPLYA